MPIDYDNLTCRECDTDLPNPGYRLTYKQAENRMCKTCRADMCRKIGRIPSKRNASVAVTDDMKQVILGSILGDGHLAKPPPTGVNWRLEIKHSIAQENYLDWKASILGGLISKKDYIEVVGGFENAKKQVRIRTISHPYLTKLSKEWTKNKSNKTVSQDDLQNLGPLGMAVWYLDDGNFVPEDKEKGFQAQIRLATCSFSKKAHDHLFNCLKLKVGVSPLQYQWTKGNETWPGIRLYGNSEIQRFFDYLDDRCLKSRITHKLPKRFIN